MPLGLPDPGAEELDPRLGAIVGAILDGGAVDWSSCTDGASGTFRDELRIVADVAGVHRSLAAAEAASDAPAFSPHLPWNAGPLTITGSLGKGAFGEVFRAWDTRLHRDVALKLLFRDRGHEDDADRFLEEGRLLARVRHPNVVTVHGTERIQGRVGLITEFVDGRTLADIVREGGPLPTDHVLSIGLDLCRALSAVHDAGLLHRDIKPQNVMRQTDGRIVLMDFGAGHRGEAVAQALAGTPLFLAPEVLNDEPATVRSDVYSLGVLLHYLATGKYPVTGSSLGDIRRNHAAGTRALVRAARPDVPRALGDAIDRATDPVPSRRYATADAFEEALTRSRHLPGQRRRVVWASAAVAAVIVLGTLGARRDWMTVPGIIRAGGGPPGAAGAVAADVASTTVRLLPLKGYTLVGRPSRDGRWLPYTDHNEDLWVWELGTERAQQITKKSATQETVWGSLMSPDGSRVAYNWETLQGTTELRVAAVNGGPPNSIWPAPGAGVHTGSIQPLDWSRDGQHILHLVDRSDGSSELATIAPDGTDRRVLGAFKTGSPRQASFSPDGQFVVFDLPASDQDVQRDLMIVRSDAASAARPLLTGAFNDLLPSWTPDGNGIFFVSNRSGQMSGWLLPMTGHEIAGEPAFVARNLGRIWPLGLTDTGAYFYQLQVGAAEVYTVTVDVTGTTPPGAPARIATDVTLGHMGPAWSPDGRRMAYVGLKGETAGDRDSNALIIQDLSSRQTRQLVVRSLSNIGVVPPRWSPDGRQLLVRGRDITNREGLHVIDVESGALVESFPESALNRFDWSADGRSIVFGRARRQIVSRSVSTKRETVLFEGAAHDLEWISSFGFSPGRETLAVAASKKDQRWGLFVRTPAGTLVEIHSSDRPLVFQGWTPDAQQILFTLAGQEQPHRLMRIAATGGTPVDMGLPIRGWTQPNRVMLSPDGTRVAYTAGEPGVQLWMMEGFLPR